MGGATGYLNEMFGGAGSLKDAGKQGGAYKGLMDMQGNKPTSPGHEAFLNANPDQATNPPPTAPDAEMMPGQQQPIDQSRQPSPMGGQKEYRSAPDASLAGLMNMSNGMARQQPQRQSMSPNIDEFIQSLMR